MEKRVGIFIYYEWLAIAPSILSAIRVLCQNGYAVDVFHLDDGSLGSFKPESEQVTAIPVKSGRWTVTTLLSFFFTSFGKVRKNKYTFFIGVDQEGILVSGILGKLKKVPNVYYSLEILTKEDIAKEKGATKIFLSARRLLEKYFAKRADSAIVQDKYRAEVLTQDLQIAPERVSLVPNSYDVDLTKLPSTLNLGFVIPENKRVVVYAGSVIPEMAIEELVDSTASWPKDVILLIHTPYETPYLKEIKELVQARNLQGRVLFSERKLSFEELIALLQKADIGISLYRFANISFELATSGKLSMYLMAGLPFISIHIPYVEELIKKYQCGICVETPQEIGKAVQTILDNYAAYAKNTKKCYDEELTFSKHFQAFLERYGPKH